MLPAGFAKIYNLMKSTDNQHVETIDQCSQDRSYETLQRDGKYYISKSPLVFDEKNVIRLKYYTSTIRQKKLGVDGFFGSKTKTGSFVVIDTKLKLDVYDLPSGEKINTFFDGQTFQDLTKEQEYDLSNAHSFCDFLPCIVLKGKKFVFIHNLSTGFICCLRGKMNSVGYNDGISTYDPGSIYFS